MDNITVAEFRTYVRDHMDLDSTELPDELLDAWLESALIAITNFRADWRPLEANYAFTTIADQQAYDLGSMINVDNALTDLNEVASVEANNRTLQWIGKDEAMRRFPITAAAKGQPLWYTVWDERMYLYPTPTDTEALYVRGYRFINWVEPGGGGGG